MPDSYFQYVFQSNEQHSLSVETFLKNCSAQLGCPLSDEKLADCMQLYVVKEEVTYIESIEAVLNRSLILYETADCRLELRHELNDPQEKVVNYAYCLLVFEKKDTKLSIHWGNFVQELRLSDFLVARLTSENLSYAIILDYWQRFRFCASDNFNDITAVQEKALKQLLCYCESGGLEQEAIRYKAAAKVLKQFTLNGNPCKIIELPDYDDMYITKRIMLSFEAPGHPLFYRIFSKWDIKKAPETFGLEGYLSILESLS